MGFIGKDDGSVGDKLKQGGRRFARLPPGQPARVVFDPGARTGRLQHLKIKVGALFQPLCLKQFALDIQLFQAVKELILDALDRLLQRRARGDIVRIRIDADLLKTVGLGPRQRIKFYNCFKLFAKEGKAPSPVVKVGGPNFQTVAPHPERATRKCLIVAAVLLGHQFGNHLALVVKLANRQVLGHGRIGLDRADAIDTRHRRDDDHIVPFQQRPGGRVAHPVDLFVDLGFFLDIGVGARDIGFGLVVVVVRHEVFDRVIGEEAFEFAIQLGRQGLVGGQNDRRALSFLDHLGHGKGLAGAGGPQKHLIALARHHPCGQFGNRRGLIARRLKRRLHDKAFAALQLGPGQHFGAFSGQVGIVVGHGDSLSPQSILFLF